jgi:biotin carboxyl carrier protein
LWLWLLCLAQVATENVPNLGDSITEGTVQVWSKGAPHRTRNLLHCLKLLCSTQALLPVCAAVGDYVKADDVLAVVETDKVAVDIRSTKAGNLVKQVRCGAGTVMLACVLMF